MDLQNLVLYGLTPFPESEPEEDSGSDCSASKDVEEAAASDDQLNQAAVNEQSANTACLRADTCLHLGVFICHPTFSSHPKCSSHLRFLILHPSSCPSHLVHLLASSSFDRISSA